MRITSLLALLASGALTISATPAVQAQAANAPAVALPTIPLATDTPLDIAAPGQAVKITATLPSTVVINQNADLQWTATDIAGKTVASVTEPIAAGVPPPSFTLTPTTPGIVYIAVGLESAGVQEARGDTRLAVWRTVDIPNSTVPCLYAANVHMSPKAVPQAEQEMALMHATGFTGCRYGVSWGAVEPNPGQFDWIFNDLMFADFKKYRIIPTVGLAYTAKWASTGDQNAKDWHAWNNAPPKTDAFAEYARQSAARYKGYTHYWEIWNEPDLSFWLGTAQQYADLFGAAYRAIHSVDPQSQVMNGGFSETKRNPNFIPTFLSLVDPKPDIYAFHSHGPVQNLETAWADTQKYLANAHIENIPIWLNEAGYSNVGHDTEWNQASQLVKKMVYTPAHGIQEYAWYDIRNDGDDPNNNEHNFGLVRHDFSPKASLVAAHTLFARITGKRFVRSIPLGATGLGYIFSDGRKTLMVAWADLPIGATQDVLIRLRAPSAKLTDIMGVEQDLPSRKGLAGIPISRDPQLVTFDSGPNAIVPAPAALTAPSVLNVVPGEPVDLPVAIANPTDAPLQATVTASSSPTLPKTITLPRGGTQSVTLHLLDTAPSRTQRVTISLSAAELPSNLTSTVTLRPALIATAVPAQTPLESRAPTVVLHAKQNGVSLFLNTPMRELQLRDDQDISANVFLAHDTHNILVDLLVQDDIQSQDYTGANLWQGDSVQLALHTPDGRLYEWCSALTKTGPQTNVDIAPPADSAAATALEAAISRDGATTTYRLSIPDTIPGIAESLKHGCSLDVLVNDNDGQGRKGWIEWTPGIGATKDPTAYMPVVFR